MRKLVSTMALIAALAGCKEDLAQAPDPVPLTEDAVSFFCQMHVLEHGGPKAQIHLEGQPAPLFFAQVRDGVAYLKSPERSARILATYVSDMGAADGWNLPGISNWTDANTAHFVIEAGVRGGMGAPEVAPFAHLDDARAFVERYGGRIVALSEIPDSVVLGPIDPDTPLEDPS